MNSTKRDDFDAGHHHRSRLERFCAGMDLKALPLRRERQPARTGPTWHVHPDLHGKPMIRPRLRDGALAGGFEVALGLRPHRRCRKTRSSASPKLSAASSLLPGGCSDSPTGSRRRSPWGMALTGDPLTAEQAYHCGLVNLLSPEGEAPERRALDALRHASQRTLHSPWPPQSRSWSARATGRWRKASRSSSPSWAAVFASAERRVRAQRRSPTSELRSGEAADLVLESEPTTEKPRRMHADRRLCRHCLPEQRPA